MYGIMRVVQMCPKSTKHKRRFICEATFECTGTPVHQSQKKKALMWLITEERQRGNSRLLDGNRNGDVENDGNGDGNHSGDVVMVDNAQAHRYANEIAYINRDGGGTCRITTSTNISSVTDQIATTRIITTTVTSITNHA